MTCAYYNTYYNDSDSNNPHIIMCEYKTENKKNSVIVIIITEGQTEFKCNTVNDSIVRI